MSRRTYCKTFDKENIIYKRINTNGKHIRTCSRKKKKDVYGPYCLPEYTSQGGTTPWDVQKNTPQKHLSLKISL